MFGLVRSDAEARNRRGVRRMRRASCRRSVTFISVSPREKDPAQALASLVERCPQRNRATRAVKYQTWHGPLIPVRAQSSHSNGSSTQTRLVSTYHNASLTAANAGL